jgi:hypothetical protein
MTNVFYQIGLLMMVSLLLLFFLAWLIYRDNKDKTEFEKTAMTHTKIHLTRISM